MTDRQLDQTISDWLEAEAPKQVSDRVLRATFERTRGTRQQIGWRALPRRLSMPKFVSALAAAAIVLLVGVVGLRVYFNGTGVGVAPSPTPLASPSPAPTSSECVEFPGGGSYTAPAGSLSLTVSVPNAGREVWHGNPRTFEMLRVDCSAPYGPGGFFAQTVTQVYPDACAWGAGGRAVDDVPAALAALANVPLIEVRDLTDVTVDGYPGSRFVLSALLVFDVTGCRDGMLKPLNGVPGMGSDNAYTVWLIDVEGEIIALTVPEYASQPRDVAAQLEAMIDSMQIER